MIPWRVKNFISNNFPLFYYRMVNFNKTVNSDKYWDKIYEAEWDSPKRIWPTKNRLIESKTRKTDAILDVACGTGSILRYLKSKGYEDLSGTELSDLCVERLQAGGIRMVKSVLPVIEYSDDSFDVVIASQILEHLIDRESFLTEIKRIMKPASQCFIFVPDNCLGPIDEPSHVIKFTEKSLRKLLAKIFDDFEIVSMKDENFEMSILFAHIKG